METEDYRKLELIADFFDTHDKRMRFEGDTGIENLREPENLYSWLLNHQLIMEGEEVSGEDLKLAIQLRTEARKLIINNGFSEETDENALNGIMNSFQFKIRFSGGNPALQSCDTNGRKALAKIALLIYELKKKELWNRIRVCSAEDCQWVFVDYSRPGTGKWCTMKACGNRAKNKTYRQKRKLTGEQ